MGGRIRWSKLDIGIAAKRRQIEQQFVLTGAWAFDWYKSQGANTPLTPKIEARKTSLLGYGQTAAYGAHFGLLIGVVKS